MTEDQKGQSISQADGKRGLGASCLQALLLPLQHASQEKQLKFLHRSNSTMNHKRSYYSH